MRIVSLVFLIFFPYSLCSQSDNISVWETKEKISLDGVLDEDIWQQGPTHPPFWQYAPNDSIQAELPTEIKMASDGKYLYVVAICHAKSREYVIPSLKRDFRAGGNDNITFLIDPFNDRINAFMFGTNPLGVKREGLISGGGESLSGFSVSWDNKWRSAAKNI